MAKSKGFFGLRRGSTKSLTFQVLNGKQITKDRVSDVKNPRTTQQMGQRVILATASAAYARMKQIVDHSFEGVSYGQNSMSYFTSKNADLLKASAAALDGKFGFNAYRDRTLHKGAYLMAQGSLPEPDFKHTVETSAGAITISLNDITAAGAAPTANELASFLGLSIGEMVTICFIAESSVEGDNTFGFVRIKMVQGGDTVLTAANFEDYFVVESTQPGETITVNATSVVFAFGGRVVADDYVQHCAIYSRQTAQGWLRSKAVMNLPLGGDFELGYNEALATFPGGKSYVLNGGNF